MNCEVRSFKMRLHEKQSLKSWFSLLCHHLTFKATVHGFWALDDAASVFSAVVPVVSTHLVITHFMWKRSKAECAPFPTSSSVTWLAGFSAHVSWCCRSRCSVSNMFRTAPNWACWKWVIYWINLLGDPDWNVLWTNIQVFHCMQKFQKLASKHAGKEFQYLWVICGG